MSVKKGIVVGASRDAVHAIKKAQEHGIFVVALDGNPDAEGFKYANKSIVADISDLNKVCSVIEQIEPDFTIPVPIGCYLTTMAYVNDKFGLRGIGFEAATLSTDKYLFHKRLSENNLRNIKLFLINKNTDLNDIEITYPAIIKPRYGSGSRDIYYINNDNELFAAYNDICEGEEDFILEQAVVGVEYGADGAVIDGTLKLTLLRKKIITPLPIRQAISNFSVVEKEENRELINNASNYLQKIVNTLGYDNCLIHADLIISDESIFVIEIAPRPSGQNLHDIFVPCVTGVDMVEEFIKLQMGESCNFVPHMVRCMQIRFFDFENVVITKVPTADELNASLECNIIMWNCNIVEGQYMNSVINGHSIMNRGFFIVEGADEEALVRQSEWVLSQFKCER